MNTDDTIVDAAVEVTPEVTEAVVAEEVVATPEVAAEEEVAPVA